MGTGACFVDREWIQSPPPAESPPTGDYIVNAGVVSAPNVGLTWQSLPGLPDVHPSGSATAAEASCSALTLGGFTDWRLPTRIELLSIIDSSLSGYATNQTAFPRPTAVGSYWTSTPLVTDLTKSWVVDFTTGGSMAVANSQVHYVRCVR